MCKYLTALLLFGSNGLVASYIALSSYEIVLLRSFLGSIFLLALFCLSGQKFTIPYHRKDAILIALSGAAMAADWLFLFEAYQQIGVSLGMLINYIGPVLVTALSPFLFGERITSRKAAALGIALLGVFCISGQAAVQGIRIWGLVCAGLSAVAYTAMVISNKKAQQVKGMENAVLQILFAFLTVAVFVGCKQGFHMTIALKDWLPILWLGFVNTGLSCYCYFSAIGKLPVQTVAICGYLEPLSAVLLSFVFLGESMQPIQIAGAVCIIGGAILGEYSK